MSGIRESDYRGNLKELFLLFLPVLLITFSNCLFLLVEKLLLGRLSTQAMEAAVNAAYACQIFQGPCVALAMMTQVFVGRWYGAKEYHLIGPGVWQFIWFSIFSMLITLPLGIWYGNFYFNDTALQDVVKPYYYFLISVNFLYPLAATLSCFYLGQGKTRLVLLLTLGSQIVKLVLAYLFIFGWKNIIPEWGLMGGALSTFLAQAGHCLILLTVFLNGKQSKIFNTWNWSFKPQLFWECIHPGFLRALNRILNFTSWASIAHLMTAKGGDYLLVLSVGGTLFLFLPFLGDAVCQAQTTIVSHILGAKNYHLLNRSFRSGMILVGITVFFLSIPLLFFPLETFAYLFPKVILEPEVIKEILLGVWASFIFFTSMFVPLSFILAFKDTMFSFLMGCLNWINGFSLMYVAIKVVEISADQFWLTLSIMHGSTAIFYFWRMKVLQNKAKVALTPI